MAEEVPDIYCDGVQVGVTPYDVVLQLQKRPIENMGNASASTRTVGVVRISLEQAKVLAIILKSSLKLLEENQGVSIPVHPTMRHTLGISKSEDW